MCFYAIIVWFSFLELMEVWACVCIVELLLPIRILVAGMQLKLYGIQYFHAKTSDVYDPRDPATGERAFPVQYCSRAPSILAVDP